MSSTGRLTNILIVCIFIISVFSLVYVYLMSYEDSSVRHVQANQEIIRVTQTLSVDCENYLNDSSSTSSSVDTMTQAVMHSNIPWIFTITPTYKRSTQVVDITSLCQTLQLVPNLVWIVIEDGYLKSDTISDLLRRCTAQTVHLIARNISEWTSPAGRGVAQRNAGLIWIRENCHSFGKCNGSFYFMDDDNKYALSLFDEIRSVKFIGLWPVAYAGFLHFEGPICIDNQIVEWHVLFAPERKFPIDMGGFAVNVQLLLEYREALFGYNPHSRVKAEGGWQETRFLENFSSGRDDPRVECKGSRRQAFVWHIKTKIDLKNETNIWKHDLITK